MRAYVSRRGHVGFRFGCLGTVVLAAVIMAAVEAVVALGVLVGVAVLVTLAVAGTVRAVRNYRRTTIKIPRFSDEPRRRVRR